MKNVHSGKSEDLMECSLYAVHVFEVTRDTGLRKSKGWIKVALEKLMSQNSIEARKPIVRRDTDRSNQLIL